MGVNIAIVGLGKAGSDLFEELSGREEQGIHIVGVSELHDTPGRQKAIAAGIPSVSMQEISDQGESIDLIFDMTGHPEVRKQMREMMFASENHHTSIAPENVAFLIWALLSGGTVPAQNNHSGY